MFASYLFYQILNGVLALAVVGAFLRRAGRGQPTPLGARLGTRFRRLALLWAPAFGAFGVLLGLAGKFAVQPVAGAMAALAGFPVPWLKFIGLGVVFYAAFLWLPLAGVAVAWAARAGSGRALDRALSLAWLTASVLVAGHAVFVEPHRLVVEETAIEIDEWPPGVPPLRIAVLSDLQSPLLTDRERMAVELVRDLRPDLVLFTGDLVAQSLDLSLALEAGRFAASSVSAPHGSFAVNGDVDGVVLGGLRSVLRGTGTRLLDNGATVLFAGLRIELAGFDPRRPTEFNSLLEQDEKARIRIAVVHRPRYAQAIADAGFDLIVAGHTHGGQVVLPWVGPPITASPLPRSVAAGGLHPLQGGAQLYISRGVGMESGFAPPIRFRCAPEVSLLIVGPPRTPAAAGAGLKDPFGSG